ncbi:hypothetical protein T35B1_13578 [Salinisphaera shabanensis T35B1]|uniref:hypothetical protein n=1 Tax=Salinisphaera shabanensis TaxID=180542 RepID=UPI003340B831
MNFIEALFFGIGLMNIRGFFQKKVMFVPYGYAIDPRTEESELWLLYGLFVSIVMFWFGVDYGLHALFDWSVLDYSDL